MEKNGSVINMHKKTRKFDTNIRPIKPKPINMGGWQQSSGEGLYKLRTDIKTGYKYLKGKREKRIEAGEKYSNVRPKGVFPYKDFDGDLYKFDSWYTSITKAKKLCDELQSIGMKCRISRIKGKYVVYTKGIIM